MVSLCYNLQPISSFVLHFSVALAPFCYDLYAVFLNAAKLPYPGADRSEVDQLEKNCYFFSSQGRDSGSKSKGD